MAAGRRILDCYGAAGGGLLAGGLAYAALFAIVPAVLLLAGAVGLVVGDPAERARVVDVLADVLPPLRDLIDVVLSEAARDAAPVSILGAVALLWGTSRFAVAFQDAIARVMGGEKRRGLFASNAGAVAAVVLMIVAIFLSTMLSGVLEFLEAGASVGAFPFVGGAISIALGLLPVVATVGATILVYRIVPVPSPPWRAVVLPGIGAGLALTIVARIFAFLAPRLIGSAALLGTLATAFAALAWLALSFQALLLGVAWVRDRADRVRPSGAKEIHV
ncbi:MAG TPA: YihY/virulence factor BrkB family protein [Candidatus Limnocylindria bacterium]|nr:YihY/virulence factor BrkB family protein [Candidatus Limnocylindria bacterium]